MSQSVEMSSANNQLADCTEVTPKMDMEADQSENGMPEATASHSPPTTQVPSQPSTYQPPSWACSCPAKSGYRLEVIKTGIPLPECTIFLSRDDDAEPISYCLFGRQPQSHYAPSGKLIGECATQAHPSISRLHAVLQYGRPPMSIARTADGNTPTEGWYLQDLDSTHGTFVNKRRLPPGRFVRIHVGYVIRFGGSTRLHVFEGPEEDMERESSLSWTELKEAYKARKESAKLTATQQSTETKVDMSCDWGMSAEDANTQQSNFLASIDSAACLSHEHLYRDDPKRALLAYFDREGIDPHPEFEFAEASFGKQHCKIELPLPTGTVIAEAIITGKRKEAIAACALEACQLLDRLGEFDPNKSSAASRKQTRSLEYWEENAYYSSDEDTFVDRTGQVERKRLERIRQLGVEGHAMEEAVKQVAQLERKQRKVTELALDKVNMLSVLSELEKIGHEIVALEDQLEKIDKEFMPDKENPSELDELEAYMTALKSGAPTRKERLQLKSRLFSLRQAEMRLFHKAGLTQPIRSKPNDVGGRAYRLDAAAAVRAAKRKLDEESSVEDLVDTRSNNTRLLRDEIKRSLPSHAKPQNRRPKSPIEPEEFQVEEDADSESEKEIPLIPVQIETLPSIDHREQLVVEQEQLTMADDQVDMKSHPSSAKTSNSPPEQFQDEELPKCTPSLELSSDFPDEGSPPVILSSHPVTPKKKKEPTVDVYQLADPDYVTWVPPADQSGDGTTSLNTKYGY